MMQPPTTTTQVGSFVRKKEEAERTNKEERK
jgi:hypothetical protein